MSDKVCPIQFQPECPPWINQSLHLGPPHPWGQQSSPHLGVALPDAIGLGNTMHHTPRGLHVPFPWGHHAHILGVYLCALPSGFYVHALPIWVPSVPTLRSSTYLTHSFNLVATNWD